MGWLGGDDFSGRNKLNERDGTMWILMMVAIVAGLGMLMMAAPSPIIKGLTTIRWGDEVVGDNDGDEYCRGDPEEGDPFDARRGTDVDRGW